MLLTWKILHLFKTTNWNTDSSPNFTSTPTFFFFFLADFKKQFIRGKANEGPVATAPAEKIIPWIHGLACEEPSQQPDLMPTSVLIPVPANTNWFFKDVFSSFSTSTKGLSSCYICWSLNHHPLLAHTLRKLKCELPDHLCLTASWWGAKKKNRPTGGWETLKPAEHVAMGSGGTGRTCLEGAQSLQPGSSQAPSAPGPSCWGVALFKRAE